MIRIRKVIYYLAITIIIMITFFALRPKDLTVHIIVESSAPKKLIKLQLNNKIVFKEEVNSGVYWGNKIVLENTDIGIYSVEVEAVEDGILYQKNKFFIFNRTMIITYFDVSALGRQPYFDMWSKFGKFIPD